MRIAARHVYPVKGCRAMSLQESAVGPLGLEHDRRFAFVHPDGLALTQREQPLLATVRPTLEADGLRLDFGGLLELSFAFSDFTQALAVDVWGNRIAGRAVNAGPGAEYLGAPLRLALLEPSASCSFADARPVLVTTSGMLADLNARLSSPVGMERFRPNVVLDGADAAWSRLRGAQAELERAKPCGRCEVTTIDQTSGARRGEEPLRTLHAAFNGEFGIYCTVARSGRLRIGESLQAV